ncbi:MAG: Wzz/FepE/Etk N-terminal domain-containing protein [Leptonema sp. (in: bacteria)]
MKTKHQSTTLEKDSFLQDDMDEIDLYELYLTLQKRKNIILLTIIVIFLGGIVVSLFIRNPYTYEFQIKSNLDLYAITNPTFLLSRRDLMWKVKNFIRSYEENQKGLSINIKEDKQDPTVVLVTIKTTNKDILPKVIQELKIFLENDPILKELRSLKEWREIQERKEIREFIKNQRKIIDSLENLKNPNLGYDIHNSSLELMKRERLLQILEKIELLEFRYPKFPEKPQNKKAIVLTISFFLGLFLGVFLALFLEYWYKRKASFQNRISG